MCRKHSLLLLALIAASTLLPCAALAQDGRSQLDTKLGALASIGCGVFVRATLVTAGTQVGTIVGAVACCGYMLFDAFVVDTR
jgi:hypothetical protein